MTARLGALLLLLVAASAFAQPVYRQVDRNGKVIFSDQPPTADTRPAVSPSASAAPASDSGSAALPYELRQVVQRYPVVLYTSDPCAPCATGRALLTSRGVPFEERTIVTDADSQALQRLSGQNSLPLLSIGAQQLKGFSDAQWSQYLDAAGYPKSNLLPAGYRSAPARPLVAQQPALPAAPGPVSAPSAPPPADSAAPSPANPAGIRF